jgi:alpha-tubulin suppressor-like RCC1 family protein
MQVGLEKRRYSLIAFVSACFFLCEFIFPISVYAAGEIVAWGYNNYGQCNVPEPNTGFTAIAAGGSHSLGLKTDGSIVAWGYNEYGQCNVPEPNTGFTAIAAGNAH